MGECKMEIMFPASDILKRGRGLTFDDVLLVPQHSQVNSRRHPSLEAQLTKNITLKIPILTANMDTITEYEMSCAMSLCGGLGILHRFMPLEEQLEQIKKIQKFHKTHNLNAPIAASIGVKEEALMRADRLVDAGVQILTIDIAHGDSVLMFETLDYIKKKFPSVNVIAGNVATAEGVRGLIDHGADAVKVGIGPGSMCTTRLITGCGVPQLTAVSLCSEEASRSGIPVIADGGLRNSGDIVKAFCAGASTVMLGSMVSGCLETPGEIRSGKKRYRGMASKEAQVSWRGELPEGMAAEGESSLITCKGSVNNVISEVTGGIRSGMAYLNAIKLGELRQKAMFMEMTFAGFRESGAHGVFS